MTPPVVRSTATADGSSTSSPRPAAHTLVLTVPMSIATPTRQRIVPPFTPTATLTCQVWCPVRGSWGNQADQRQISLIYASTCAPSQELPGAALLIQATPDLFCVVPGAVTLVWRARQGSAGQQSAWPGVSGCSAV